MKKENKTDKAAKDKAVTKIKPIIEAAKEAQKEVFILTGLTIGQILDLYIAGDFKTFADAIHEAQKGVKY